MRTLKKTKYLTTAEYDRLLGYLARMKSIRPRDTALIYTALATGARAQEILNIRPEDLDPQTNKIHIRGLKGSYDREVMIHPWLMGMLLALIEKPKQSLVFTIGYHRFQEIWKQYRPHPKKTLHSTRHSFGLRLYERTRDLLAVQRALGHKSITNTFIYVLTVQSEEERALARDIALPVMEVEYAE